MWDRLNHMLLIRNSNYLKENTWIKTRKSNSKQIKFKRKQRWLYLHQIKLTLNEK